MSNKQSLIGIDEKEIFREVFNSEFDVRNKAVSITGSPLFTNNEVRFISGNSDKITYPIVNGIKTIVFEIILDTLTENILDFDGGTKTITVSSGTITSAGISSPIIYINGKLTSTITLKKSIVVITTSTSFDATAFDVGSGLDGKLSLLKLLNVEWNAKEVELDYGNNLYRDNRIGLIGEWKLDRQNSSDEIALDTSRKNNHGTITPGASAGFVPDHKGNAGRAYDFDGVDTKIDTGTNMVGTGTNSVSAWIKAIGYGEDGTNGVIFDNGKFRLSISVAQKVFITSNSINFSGSAVNSIQLNTWYYIVGTREADGTANLYIDGVLSGNANQDSGTPEAGITNLIIGNNDAQDDTFDGIIADARIYNKVLTPTEIRMAYKRGRAWY